MSLVYLPTDIYHLITDFLSITELYHLSQVCKVFNNYVVTRFMYYKNIEDPLLPTKWPRLKKYAALESRKRIFPEALAFLDLTVILLRCLECNDTIHYNYFWKIVQTRREENPFQNPVSYFKLIEKAIVLVKDDKLIEELFCNCFMDTDTVVYLYQHLVSRRPGWKRRFLLKKLIEQYFEHGEWYLPTDIVEPIWDVYDSKYNHIIRKLIDDNKTGDFLVYFQTWPIDSRMLNYAIGAACVGGRKDLFEYLESRLGFLPYYDWVGSVLDTLEYKDIRNWLEKRSRQRKTLS